MRELLLAAMFLLGCSENNETISSGEREKPSGPNSQSAPPRMIEVPSSAELARIAFPSSKPVRDSDGAEWVFRKHKVISLNRGFALISEGELTGESGSHSTSGRLDVFYFGNAGIYVKERFPEAVTIGSWGAIGEWALTDKFTANPVIYASGGFTGQGITEGCSSLTELTPEGPRTVALIPDYYGGTSIDGADFETKGKISEISKGNGFDVLYSGTQKGRLRYKWTGVKFATSDEAVLTHCGFE